MTSLHHWLIINTCIGNRVFPSSWKMALVCPLLKVDHSKRCYRIQTDCILSKVLQRVILHQLCHFLEVKAYYNQTQLGFRKGHSRTTVLLKFRDDIKRAMKTSKVILGILLDYSKPFDTIDHLTLLVKLHKLNFSKQALKLIHSDV